MNNQAPNDNQKSGFNFLAFLFPVPYYAGKGKFKRALLLAVCGSLPFLMVIPSFWGGFKANKELGNAKFKWGPALLALIIYLLMLSTVLSIRDKIKNKQSASNQPSIEKTAPVEQDPVAQVEMAKEPTPAPETAIPEAQASFVKIVTDAQKKNAEAQNEMQKGGVKAEREKAICESMKELNVQNWVGKIKTIDANSDGKGELAIELAQDMSVSNKGTLSDAMSGQEILLDPTSELFKKVSGMAEGQSVKFSGNFYKGEETDCLSEISLTLEGKLSEPEFVFRFLAVDTI